MKTFFGGESARAPHMPTAPGLECMRRCIRAMRCILQDDVGITGSWKLKPVQNNWFPWSQAKVGEDDIITTRE